MQISQSPLPFSLDALEPHISARTLDIHYNDYHAGYVRRTNELLEKTRQVSVPLEYLVIGAYRAGDFELFNNAAQAWNHTFHWQSLRPRSVSPDGRLMRLIERDFGSLKNLQRALIASVTSHVGSGWVWLVMDGERLRVTQTQNAQCPQLWQQVPLLAIDVWEHAYFLDHESHVEDYASALVKNLLNWKFAENNVANRRSALVEADWPVPETAGKKAGTRVFPHYHAVSLQRQH